MLASEAELWFATLDQFSHQNKYNTCDPGVTHAGPISESQM